MITHNRLIIISDLHLGGTEPAPRRVNGEAKGSRINSSYRELGEFIDWVAADPCPTEMILNGDIVDFLLDDEHSLGRTFIESPAEACAKLEFIAHDCPAFAAWGQLIRNGHRLTLLLGNHDVELSFPAVRECFAKLLDVGTHQIEFIVDGEAITRGKVLIEHGNRYDPWNWIDHDGLRHERSLQSRAVARNGAYGSAQFLAPRGTHLVTELMNKLKSRYRFVDLLKPETHLVLPMLCSLDINFKDLVGIVPQALNASAAKFDLYRVSRNAFHPTDGNLINASGDVSFDAELETSLKQGLGDDFALLNWSNISNQVSTGKFQTFRNYVSETVSALWSNVNENVRRLFFAAMRYWNAGGRNFDTKFELDQYRLAAQKLVEEGEFEVVIFGHTHLPKQLALGHNDARYFNTGTWVDVMRVDEISAMSTIQCEEIRKRLACNQISDYLRSYRSYAEVIFDDNLQILEAGVYSYLDSQNRKVAIEQALQM